MRYFWIDYFYDVKWVFGVECEYIEVELVVDEVNKFIIDGDGGYLVVVCSVYVW